MLAVAVVLLALAIVYTITATRSTQTQAFEQTYMADAQCSRIALAISNVYSSGIRSRLLLETENEALVGESNVAIRENGMAVAYCDFPAKAQPAVLAAGQVEAKNVNGVVVLSNV